MLENSKTSSKNNNNCPITAFRDIVTVIVDGFLKNHSNLQINKPILMNFLSIFSKFDLEIEF